MDKKYLRTLTGLFVSCLIVTSGAVGFSATWNPFEFRGNESYRYQVTWEEEAQSAIYELLIEELDNGNFRVKYGTEVEISPEELSSEMVFGFWGGYGPSLSFLFMNPMYEMLFSQLELNVGEKMSYYGQGKMEVVGRETIAGLEGYVCKFSDSDGELIAEWVIKPELGLPLRSRLYEGGGSEGEINLLSYESF